MYLVSTFIFRWEVATGLTIFAFRRRTEKHFSREKLSQRSSKESRRYGLT